MDDSIRKKLRIASAFASIFRLRRKKYYILRVVVYTLIQLISISGAIIQRISEIKGQDDNSILGWIGFVVTIVLSNIPILIFEKMDGVDRYTNADKSAKEFMQVCIKGKDLLDNFQEKLYNEFRTQYSEAINNAEILSESVLNKYIKKAKLNITVDELYNKQTTIEGNKITKLKSDRSLQANIKNEGLKTKFNKMAYEMNRFAEV